MKVPLTYERLSTLEAMTAPLLLSGPLTNEEQFDMAFDEIRGRLELSIDTRQLRKMTAGFLKVVSS